MKCVVSLSGGRDSATCLGVAVDKYGAENVYAIGFDYGSTHPQELQRAQLIAAYYEVPYKIIKIDPSIFEGSTCTMLQGATEEIEKDKTYEEILAEKAGKVSTYVPARNTLFSAYSLAIAESISQQFGDEDVIIMLGQHADDSGFIVGENGEEILDETRAAYPDAVAAGSKVLMADWTYRNIEDINPGEYIWGINEHTGKLQKAQVLHKIFKGTKRVYRALGDLWVSENHLMFKPLNNVRVAPYGSLKDRKAKYKAYVYSPKFPQVNNLHEYNMGYLRGFWEGDGWFCKRGEEPGRGVAFFCQKDRKVLEEIQQLLREVESISSADLTIYYRPHKNDDGYIHNMCLHSQQDTEIFLKSTQFRENKDYALGYLAGMFVAEGSYNRLKDGSQLITLCQSVSKNELKVHQIDKCFELIGVTPSTWMDRTQCKNWAVKRASSFPLLYGGNKRDKFLEGIQQASVSFVCKKSLINPIVTAEVREDVECWDLTTESGTFFADSVLVHNCTISYVNAFAEVAKISSVGKVHYEAPFVKMHKWELIKTGLELKKRVPYELCLSCYDPIVHENGDVEECGRCATCLDVQINMNKALDVIEKENPELYEEVKYLRV